MRSMSCSLVTLVFVMFTTIWLHLLASSNARIKANEIGGVLANCPKGNIKVIQVPNGTLPSGRKIFSVMILNECPTGCSVEQIHLSCDSFQSERLINPYILRRLSNNDCLVNDGKPLANGAVVSFNYASTTQFPLAVSSVTCSN